ncbi:hypothetical protein [Roseomonas sp. AR75]|uniref:hypothetical protein n=1 Tax=Roseomonas sp. AR75 TaxID=2562311 RepID=UPI0010C07BCB|nr:hypothetical protein [Roseomonas sp. AR75]
MDGGQEEFAIERAATRPSDRQETAAELWLRVVRTWLGALSYRPERRYMRGGPKAATTEARA